MMCVAIITTVPSCSLDDNPAKLSTVLTDSGFSNVKYVNNLSDGMGYRFTGKMGICDVRLAAYSTDPIKVWIQGDAGYQSVLSAQTLLAMPAYKRCVASATPAPSTTPTS